MPAGTLYLGDNLDFIRDHERIPPESIDLVYLDPPFNSDRTYNTLFEEHQLPIGDEPEEAQQHAFKDTWTWNREAQRAYDNIDTDSSLAIVKNIVQAFCREFPRSDMAAYLVMMAERLLHLHRVLKRTGSLYLHCDPTAGPYLRLLLDRVFKPENFRNEIVWQRAGAKNDPKRLGRSHDTIFFYTVSDTFTWNPQFTPFQDYSIKKNYTVAEPGTGRVYTLSDLTANKPGGDTDYEWKGVRPYKGRHWAFSKENMEKFEAEGRLVYRRTGMPRYKRYLDEMPGVPLHDVWIDIRMGTSDAQRVGYPTQKPQELLERIISASSNPGDVVLDPFCGCGTTVDAAQHLGRRWIGIDLAIVAIKVIEKRLEDTYGKLAFEFDAIPRDANSAIFLADRSIRYHNNNFQEWAVKVLRGEQTGGRRPKAGRDEGIDGLLRFRFGPGRGDAAIIQVKGGKSVGPKDVRDLLGTMTAEKRPLGVLFTAHSSTSAMKKAAVAAGSTTFEGRGGTYPRVQLISAAEWFKEKRPQVPGDVVDPPGAAPSEMRAGENYTLPGIAAPLPKRKAVVVQLGDADGERKGPKSAGTAHERKRARTDQD